MIPTAMDVLKAKSYDQAPGPKRQKPIVGRIVPTTASTVKVVKESAMYVIRPVSLRLQAPFRRLQAQLSKPGLLPRSASK